MLHVYMLLSRLYLIQCVVRMLCIHVVVQAVPDTMEADIVRQSIVVLMGTLAQHMDKDNPKVSVNIRT